MTPAKHRIPLFQRLEIESQSNCNRSCWFCPRTYDRSGDYLDQNGRPVLNHLGTGKILDLLDQGQQLGFCGQVAFHFYSEPLLDKRSPMLAREAKKRGMQTLLHTNGDVLKQQESLCREIEDAFDEIVMGLYDYETEAEREETIQFWRRRLSKADVKFSSIGPWGVQKGKSMAIPRALVPTDARMGVPDLTFRNAPCHRPLVRMLVRHDGLMVNCCEDIHGDFELGNVYESTLEELWFSEHHLQIVENLIAGRREHYKLCRNCPAAPSGPAPVGRKIKLVPRLYSID